MGLTDFFTAIQGAVTTFFAAGNRFLLHIELWALNLTEVVLFLVFFALMVALLVAPAKVYEYFRNAAAPVRRAFDWMRR